MSPRSRRHLLQTAVTAGVTVLLAGCTSVGDSFDGAAPTRTASSSPTATAIPEKTGTVDDSQAAHASITYHHVFPDPDSASNEWVLSVNVELAATTRSMVGVRMQFLDAEGGVVHEVVKTIPRQHGDGRRSVMKTARFDPDADDADSFSSYHVQLEHA